ncbi:unnamed protein product, partial [Phaeothamnion confervicola]
MPEVHVIGEIVGGVDFACRSRLCVQWTLVTNTSNSILQGSSSGFTHVDDDTSGGTAEWNHPVDLHLFIESMAAWPRLNELVGYGACFVPPCPGAHDLDVPIWRPRGTHWWERLTARFLGAMPQLADPAAVVAALGRSRAGLRTETTATVRLRLEVLAAGFERCGAMLGNAAG